MFNNLPSFFFDNPLLLQQINALLNAYNQQELTIKELKSEIKRVVDMMDNLEQWVKDEVVKAIQQMLDDGTLQRMVAEIIAGTPTKANIDFTRVGRKRFQSVDRNASGESSATYDSEYYSYTQGATSFVRQGYRYWAICNVCSNYSHFVNNNVAEIIIYNSSGTVVMRRSVTVGHANDITWNAKDDCFYIVWNKTRNAQGVESGSRNVSKIPFDNFTTASIVTKTCPTSASGLIGIDYYGGDLYVATSNKNVYRYDFENNTIEHIVTFNNTEFENIDVIQNIAVTKNFIYWLGYRPNCLIRYNRVAQAYDYVYYFPDIANFGTYKLGEPQGFNIDDAGNCYMISSMHMWKKAYNQSDMTQFWKQNIYTNGKPMSNVPTYDLKNLVVYVDNSNASFNPDGSEDNSFSYLDEAIVFAQTQTHYDKVNIELRSQFSTNYIYLSSGKSFNIYSGIKSDGTTQNVTIGGVQIDGGICTFQNITFWNSLANNSPNIDANSNTYEMYARDCVLNMAGCTFRTGKPTGIYARRTFINDDGASYGSGVTNNINTSIYNRSGTITGY